MRQLRHVLANRTQNNGSGGRSRGRLTVRFDARSCCQGDVFEANFLMPAAGLGQRPRDQQNQSGIVPLRRAKHQSNCGG
jgi:hypothetical protein